MTTTVKQTAAKNIAKSLRTQHTARRDITISALFTALVHADTSYMAGFTKADVAMFDTTLRVLLPVQFKKATGGYTYDKVKAEKIRTALGIEFQKAEWDDVADKLLNVWLNGHQKAQEEEVDVQEQRLNASKAVSRSLEKALNAGLSMHELEVLFIKFKAKNGGVITSNDVLAQIAGMSTQPAEQAQPTAH